MQRIGLNCQDRGTQGQTAYLVRVFRMHVDSLVLFEPCIRGRKPELEETREFLVFSLASILCHSFLGYPVANH